MSEAYYRKWRPLDWDHLIGQEHVTTTIKNALQNQRKTHAYLFSGPRGTGKTSTARILAKAVNCLAEKRSDIPCNQCENCKAINEGRFLDLIEIDAASNTSVDDVRSLREKINFSPSQGKFKVYIIDEVHMLSNAAFNALLKTLEEPPDHAIFILATTEVHKIPPTVLSRCQRHEFRHIPINSIQANLNEIAQKEGIEIEPAALTEIARQATGSMRDAVSLLDQLASTGKKVSLSYAKDILGTASNENVIMIANALVNNNAGGAFKIINNALDSGSDPRQFARQVVDFLRIIMLVKMGNIEKIDLPKESLEATTDLSNKFEINHLIQSIDEFDQASMSTNLGWQPGLKLELAVMHVCGNDLQKAEKIESGNKSLKTEKSRDSYQKPGGVPENEPEKEQEGSKNIKNNRSESKENKIEANITKNTEKVDIEKEGIQSHWDDIRKAAKRLSPETGALLNSCKSVSINNGKLVLYFISTILQSKMENGENKANTILAVKQITGNEVEVLCKVAPKNDQQNKHEDEIDHDGMIGTALSLGGKMTKEK